MTYVIDISKPTCWNNLVLNYKSEIIEVLNEMRPLFSSYINFANLGLNVYQLFGGIIMYEKEIIEIAKILNISFIECLLFQLTYELCSACTSAIMKSDGRYVHVRTMDWSLDLLKKITVHIKVIDGTKNLFDAVTWAGFVGIFTGIKQNKYTIALNYKRSDNPNFMENIKAVMKGYFPNAFYIRYLLSTQYGPEAIKTSKLIAPAYYTILSTELKGIIIRNRETFKLVNAPCVQTNCDNYDLNKETNIMYSHERIKYMNEIINEDLNLDEIITYISKFPVNNENTIYSVIMTPDEGFLYFKIH